MPVFEFSLKTWNGKEFATSMIEKLGLEEGGRVQQMVDSITLYNTVFEKEMTRRLENK